MTTIRKAAATALLVVLTIAATKMLFCPKEPPPRWITCDSSDAIGGLSWPVDLTKDFGEQSCEINRSNPKQLLCKHPSLVVACSLP